MGCIVVNSTNENPKAWTNPKGCIVVNSTNENPKVNSTNENPKALTKSQGLKNVLDVFGQQYIFINNL